MDEELGVKAKEVFGEYQVNACSIKNPAFGGGFHLILSESLPLRSAITINSTINLVDQSLDLPRAVFLFVCTGLGDWRFSSSVIGAMF